MNNIKFILVAIAILLTLNGCSTLPNSISENLANDNTRESTEIVNSTDENSISLDRKFTPPNFLVKEFKVANRGQNMDIKLKYELSQTLYNTLKNGPKFIFNIEFPEEIIKETGIERTDNIQGLIMNDGELSYEINFSTNLKKGLNPSTIKLINNDELSFRLIIYDETLYAVHIFENVQWADTFIYGTSENIILN